MHLSIIIPVYNERATVLDVIERVRSVPFAMPVELVVVDDGSTDGTADLLRELPPRDDVLIHLCERNGGKGAAVRRGIDVARGDYIVFQDADLELDPADLLRLLEPIADSKDGIVYGSRFLDNPPLWTNVNYWANRGLTMLTNLLYGARLTDMETCYKLFPGPFLKSLSLQATRFEIEPELTAKALRLGHRIHEVSIGYQPRSVAEGKKMRWRDGLSAVSMLVRQRVAPIASLRRRDPSG